MTKLQHRSEAQGNTARNNERNIEESHVLLRIGQEFQRIFGPLQYISVCAVVKYCAAALCR